MDVRNELESSTAMWPVRGGSAVAPRHLPPQVIIAVPSYSSLTIVLTIVGASIFYASGTCGPRKPPTRGCGA
eukprot:1002251-Prymnesium_polylepis.1